MTRLIRFALPASIAIAGFLLPSQMVEGKAEYTKKEKKACVFCHTGPAKKELNEAGEFYKQNHTLEGYVPKAK